MSRGFQKNDAGEWVPFDDDLDEYDGSPEGNHIASLKSENGRLREALEHATELLVDTWGTAMEGDPEKQTAVFDARVILAVGQPPREP